MRNSAKDDNYYLKFWVDMYFNYRSKLIKYYESKDNLEWYRESLQGKLVECRRNLYELCDNFDYIIK